MIWLAARATAGVLMAMLTEDSAVWLPLWGSLWIALVSGMLTWLETRRRHEHLLLGNLGISRGVLSGLGLLPALLLEGAMLLAGHVSA